MVHIRTGASASGVHAVGYDTTLPPKGHHRPRLQIEILNQCLFLITGMVKEGPLLGEVDPRLYI